MFGPSILTFVINALIFAGILVITQTISIKVFNTYSEEAIGLIGILTTLTFLGSLFLPFNIAYLLAILVCAWAISSWRDVFKLGATAFLLFLILAWFINHAVIIFHF